MGTRFNFIESIIALCIARGALRTIEPQHDAGHRAIHTGIEFTVGIHIEIDAPHQRRLCDNPRISGAVHFEGILLTQMPAKFQLNQMRLAVTDVADLKRPASRQRQLNRCCWSKSGTGCGENTVDADSKSAAVFEMAIHFEPNAMIAAELDLIVNCKLTESRFIDAEK